eukprot:970526-Rhodomonas_salina.6
MPLDTGRPYSLLPCRIARMRILSVQDATLVERELSAVRTVLLGARADVADPVGARGERAVVGGSEASARGTTISRHHQPTS